MSCEECCGNCYAYDPDWCWCLLWGEYRPPGDFCTGFDVPAQEEE